MSSDVPQPTHTPALKFLSKNSNNNNNNNNLKKISHLGYFEFWENVDTRKPSQKSVEFGELTPISLPWTKCGWIYVAYDITFFEKMADEKWHTQKQDSQNNLSDNKGLHHPRIT